MSRNSDVYCDNKRTYQAMEFEPNDAFNSSEITLSCTPSKEFFTRLAKPLKGDWLYEHNELGQTYKDYRRRLLRPPKINCKTILLIPLGVKTFNIPAVNKFLCFLLSYCEAFFNPLPIQIFSKILSTKMVRRRNNEHGQTQLLIGDLFGLIEKGTLHERDVYCRLGITFEDIYPGDDWNFVYGQARPLDKIGVFSFARHSPLFSHGVSANVAWDVVTNGQMVTWLRAAIRTMLHEACHMFEMKHCIYFNCLMNGNNGPGDSAGRCSFCCPVCLRKLFFALGLASGSAICPFERYQRMKSVWEHVRRDFMESSDGLDADIDWLERRLQVLTLPTGP